MNDKIMLGLIITGMLFWFGVTAIAFQKNKMLAMVFFFMIPAILVFILIIATIILLTLADNS